MTVDIASYVTLSKNLAIDVRVAMLNQRESGIDHFASLNAQYDMPLGYRGENKSNKTHQDNFWRRRGPLDALSPRAQPEWTDG